MKRVKPWLAVCATLYVLGCGRDAVDSAPRPRTECGNALVESGEACDDGNQISGDGCRSDCAKAEACGDGVIDAGEVCDDTNTTSGDGCRADCLGAEFIAGYQW